MKRTKKARMWAGKPAMDRGLRTRSKSHDGEQGSNRAEPVMGAHSACRSITRSITTPRSVFSAGLLCPKGVRIGSTVPP